MQNFKICGLEGEHGLEDAMFYIVPCDENWEALESREFTGAVAQVVDEISTMINSNSRWLELVFESPNHEIKLHRLPQVAS